MQILRNKSRARALNFVRAGLDRLSGKRLRNDRRIFRLNRDGLERRLLRLDHFRAAGDGAAGADGGDESVNLAIRVAPKFEGGGFRGRIAGLAGLSNCWQERHGFGFLWPSIRPWRSRLSCIRRAGRKHELRAEHR